MCRLLRILPTVHHAILTLLSYFNFHSGGVARFGCAVPSREGRSHQKHHLGHQTPCSRKQSGHPFIMSYSMMSGIFPLDFLRGARSSMSPRTLSVLSATFLVDVSLCHSFWEPSPCQSSPALSTSGFRRYSGLISRASGSCLRTIIRSPETAAYSR